VPLKPIVFTGYLNRVLAVVKYVHDLLLLSGTMTLDHAGGLLLLAMSTAIALLCLPSFGGPDVKLWLTWMETLSEHGLVEGYQRIDGNYPPLSHLFLFLVARFGEALGISHFLALKTGLFLFQLAATGTILAMSRSFWVAAAFNFGTVLNDVALGYLDVVFAPFLIGAVWAWRGGRPLLGATLFTITLLIKWQPLVIVPFVALYLFDISDGTSALRALCSPLFRRVVLLAAAVVLLLSPFGLEPLRAMGHAGTQPDLSDNAINLPWLEEWVLKVLFSSSYSPFDELQIWRAPTSVMILQKAVCACGLLYVLHLFLQAEKSLDNLLLASVAGFLTYTTLNAGVHENHVATAVILTFILMAHVKRDGDTSCLADRTIAVLVVAMLNINLFLFCGITGLPVVPRVVGMDVSVALAPLFIATWVLLLSQVRAVLRADLASPGIRP
jgi:hypothetical protein